MRNVLIFLFGIVTGLWLYERQERQALLQKSSRKSRTMAELSPTYKVFAEKFSQDLQKDEDTLNSPEEHTDRFRTVLKEVDFASLTEQEITIVKSKLEELVDLMWIDVEDYRNLSNLPHLTSQENSMYYRHTLIQSSLRKLYVIRKIARLQDDKATQSLVNNVIRELKDLDGEVLDLETWLANHKGIYDIYGDISFSTDYDEDDEDEME